MFGVNWTEGVLLLLLALLIFGDKLPQLIADGLRLLRGVRRMAQNATSDLSRELGTDLQLEDLHPKTFLRKHVLSEADQDALTRPLKGLRDDLTKQTRAAGRDLKDVGKRAQGVADEFKQAADVRSAAAELKSTAGKQLRTGAAPAAPPPPPAWDDAT
jgi:sec-independent protein translocase protein TatB